MSPDTRSVLLPTTGAQKLSGFLPTAMKPDIPRFSVRRLEGKDKKEVLVFSEFDTLGKTLERNAVQYGNCLAVVSEKTKITYGDLNHRVDQVARGFLALGIKKGDRVALLMDNRPEWLVVDFALAKVGAILVPINIRYRQHELDYILNHSKPTVLILIDRFIKTDFTEIFYDLCPELKNQKKESLALKKFPWLKFIFCLSDQEYAGMEVYEEIAERGKDIPKDSVASAQKDISTHDLAHILYTSGTTASPKGVMLTHSNLRKNGENIAKRMHLIQNDRLWIPIPLFFSFACANAVQNAFTRGACLVLQRHFEPEEALKIIEEERCTIMYAVPAIYLPMLDHPYLKKADISSLRSGGAMGTSQNIRRIVEEMGVTQLTNGYGMTETTAICSMTDASDPLEIRMNTNGRAFPGGEIIIKDPETEKIVPRGKEGEIRVKGYNVTQGYYNDPDKTSDTFDKEGFLRTGDIGMITEDGYLQFRGRYKDMLKTSGINVSTLEVEMFLETYPEVKEAHVVGVPDKIKEEVGIAFVRLREGSKCTEEDILKYCSGKIASFKIPRHIMVVSEFPLTGSGKVKKYELRERAIKDLNIKV